MWRTLARPDTTWRTYDPFLEGDLGLAVNWTDKAHELCQAVLSAPPPAILQRPLLSRADDWRDEGGVWLGDVSSPRVRPTAQSDSRERPAADGTVSIDQAAALAGRLRELAGAAATAPEHWLADAVWLSLPCHFRV